MAIVTHDGGFGGPINSTGLVSLNFDPDPPINFTSIIQDSGNVSILQAGGSYYFDDDRAVLRLARDSLLLQSAPFPHGYAVGTAQFAAEFRVDNWSNVSGFYLLKVWAQIPDGGRATGELDIKLSGYRTRTDVNGTTERDDIFTDIPLESGQHVWDTPGLFYDEFEKTVSLPDISLFDPLDPSNPYEKAFFTIEGSLIVRGRNDDDEISMEFDLQSGGPTPIPVPDVSPGWDLFETTSNTMLGGNLWEGVPLGTFDFGGTVGVKNIGEVDSILQRIDPATVPDYPDTAAPIDIELVALQLKSVEPVNFGAGLDFHYITLDVNNTTTGQMTITFDDPDGGTFDSFIDLDYDMRIGAIDGPIIQSKILRLDSTGVPWSRTAPPGAQLIDGVNRLLNGVDQRNDFWPSTPFMAVDLNGTQFEVDTGTLDPGDMNGDGIVNMDDVPLFILALTDRATYQALHPLVDADLVGDIDGSGTFDTGDLGAMSAMFGGPSSANAVPEPGAFLLAALGLLGLFFFAGRHPSGKSHQLICKGAR